LGKLVRLMQYMNGTGEVKLTLSADNLHRIKWYVDASFAVHPDYKSHTEATMSYGAGDGAVQSILRKQKLNTKSSTESELVGVDNVSVMILWTKLFLEEKDTRSTATHCTKTTRVLFCWKQMARKALGRGPKH
jgi:hypothetical protein